MIAITLTEEAAQHLYDEVAGGAATPRHGLSTYERRMIYMCRAVTKQLEEQGIHGVLARAWSERMEEQDAAGVLPDHPLTSGRKQDAAGR